MRLTDNTALTAALERYDLVVPVYIWSPEEEAPWSPGAANRYWLHRSLESLQHSLKALGTPLIVRSGKAAEVLLDLTNETGAGGVVCNRLFEPDLIKRDEKVADALTAQGLDFQSFNGSLMLEPGELLKKDGTPYQVFTAYAAAHQKLYQHSALLTAPKAMATVTGVKSQSLDSLNLKPSVNWITGIDAAWQPGEDGADKALQAFIDSALADYEIGRNLPAVDGVSRLSPYLHFGEISVRQVWEAICQQERNLGAPGRESADIYKKELIWREFSHHLLYHFPHMPERPLKQKFTGYPWRYEESLLRAWQQGRTGYPIVDAGMRQLWQTGWMHNRVRMIVASFLIKDLGISWQTGEEWFWDTLVDADLAQNSMNWQWVAGSGADASPFFRIFNPTLQGQKFDPTGEYVKRYVPELAALPSKYIHEPWKAPAQVLEAAGVDLGKTYPHPIIDHAAARAHALELYRKL